MEPMSNVFVEMANGGEYTGEYIVIDSRKELEMKSQNPSKWARENGLPLASRRVTSYTSGHGESLRAFTKLERKLLGLTPTQALSIEAVLRHPGAGRKFEPYLYTDGLRSCDIISVLERLGFHVEEGGDLQTGGSEENYWIALTSAGYQRAKRLLG